MTINFFNLLSLVFEINGGGIFAAVYTGGDNCLTWLFISFEYIALVLIFAGINYLRKHAF